MPSGSKNALEAKAREKTDDLLVQAAWLVQDPQHESTAGDGVAIREFKLEKGAQPRPRAAFTFHRPKVLRESLTAGTLDGWLLRDRTDTKRRGSDRAEQ